ncbi:MAG TPA: hypothetical protein EYN69_12920 [Flavobacteriales bacterium]|nr:hypothetical protein [Flavobacteriales bacterium]
MKARQNKETGKDDVAKAAAYLQERFKRLSSQFNNDYLHDVCKIDSLLNEAIEDLTKRSYTEFERNLQDKEKPDSSSYFTQTGYVIQAGKSKNRKLISRVKGDFFFHSRRRLVDFKETRLSAQKELLQDAATWLFAEINKIIEDSPEYITVYYEIEDLESKSGDSLILKAFKFRKRTWSNLTGKPISIKIPFRELLSYHLPNRVQLAVYNLFKIYGRQGFQHISGIQALYVHMNKSFKVIEGKLIRGDFSHKFLAEEQEKAQSIGKKNQRALTSETHGNGAIKPSHGNESGENKPLESSTEEIEVQDLYNEQIPVELSRVVSESLAKIIDLINEDLGRVDINGLLSRRKSLSTNSGERLRKKIKEIPGLWYKNQTLFINSALMELMLIAAQNQFGVIVYKVVKGISETFDNNVT